MTAPAPERKGTLWGTVKAVCWSFFGVRKKSAYQDDLSKLNPLHIIAAGSAPAPQATLVLLVRHVAAS